MRWRQDDRVGEDVIDGVGNHPSFFIYGGKHGASVSAGRPWAKMPVFVQKVQFRTFFCRIFVQHYLLILSQNYAIIINVKGEAYHFYSGTMCQDVTAIRQIKL